MKTPQINRSFLGILYKNDFQIKNGNFFNQEQVIDLMVSLSATDANSEKKWKGFSNSFSMTELQEEWYVYWKI